MVFQWDCVGFYGGTLETLCSFRYDAWQMPREHEGKLVEESSSDSFRPVLLLNSEANKASDG